MSPAAGGTKFAARTAILPRCYGYRATVGFVAFVADRNKQGRCFTRASPPVASGRLRSLPVASGRLRTPPVASGRLRSPSVASGRLRSPPVAPGRPRSPPVASGRLRSPPVAPGRPGRLRSPPAASGRLRSTSLAKHKRNEPGVDSGGAWVGLGGSRGIVSAHERALSLGIQ